MTYSNDVPAGTTFSIVHPPVQARIEADTHLDFEAIMEQSVEICMPYKLRPQFGFAGKTVPFKRLLEFMEAEGTHLVRDRDFTLRLDAEEEQKREEGTLYDDFMYPDLPPQALETIKFEDVLFDTGPLLHTLANDLEEANPVRASRLRHVADTFYSKVQPPSEDEFRMIADELATMIDETDMEKLEAGLMYHKSAKAI